VGFDAEWRDKEFQGSKYREILSYQFHAISHNDTQWQCFVDPQREEIKRARLKACLRAVIERGMKHGKIDKWPTEVILAGHWTLVDLTSFCDFDKFKNQFDAVRQTLVSIKKPTWWHFEDSDYTKHKVRIVLRDSKILAPAKMRSLDALGKLLGVEKIKIPPDHSIKRMDMFKRDCPAEFRAYALRDAQITALYIKKVGEIYYEITGQTDIPTTLSTVGIKTLEGCWKREGIDHLAVNGKEKVKKKHHNSKTCRLINRATEEITNERSLSEPLAKLCYHGGRCESYQFGGSEIGKWIDADLVSAYVVAMACLGVPEWAKAFDTHLLDDFTLRDYGIAQVRFRFPRGTRFPCLPVDVDGNLIYPLEGISFCASPELLLAREMGADLEILKGTVVPADANVRPFRGFAEFTLAKRNSFEKGSLDELFWKEVANSLYGKTAQGLSGKRAFENRKGVYEEMAGSKITCPLIAAQITSLIRAAVSEMMFRLPKPVTVLSVTTDGFLSNATPAQLDEAAGGSVCRLLLEGVTGLTDKTSVWDKKFNARQVLNWRTRGQVSLDEGVDEPIVANGGFRIPKKEYRVENRVEFLIKSFQEREGKISNPIDERFPSIADTRLRNKDMISRTQDRMLSMEYDFKRSPIKPCLQEIRRLDHLFFESVPWKNIEEFTSCRADWERYSKGSPKSLKTVQDFKAFEEYRSLPPGRRAKSGGALKLAKRRFLIALIHGEEGLNIEPYSYAAIAQWLTDAGYPTKKADLANAKRARLDSVEPPPLNPDVEKFYRVIETRYKYHA
jgi:hypothetical protein